MANIKEKNKENPQQTERQKIDDWKRDMLLDLGVPPDDVEELIKANVDIHDVDDLLNKKSCPPNMVVQILA